MKNSLILAIDTSCDDTAAAVTQGTRMLSNVIASQTQLHTPYGGVFPTVAKQAHKENINRVVEVALKRAGIQLSDISAIGVTQGPGLAPALEVGIRKAQELRDATKKPLIAVNHIEGHILSPLTHARTVLSGPDIVLPTLAVVVSGGHTLFVLVKKIGDYEILGSTIDDAAGECLDKIGRMLNLGYPAGPVIEQFAKLGNPQAYQFPLPLTHKKTYDLSFSGLKTYARNFIEALEARDPLSQQQLYDICASVQYSVFRHIVYKLNKILAEYEIKETWLGGGVAANMELRRMMRQALRTFYNERKMKESGTSHIPLKVPYTRRLCMDNAGMIGVAAGFKLERGEVVETDNELDRKPRWAI